MKKKIYLCLILLLANFFGLVTAYSDGNNSVEDSLKTIYLNYEQKITDIISSEKIDKSKVSILIEKAKYTLTIKYNGQPIKSYPVVFGDNPIDDKLRQGDYSTPEGKFKIRDMYPHPDWSKFIWIDYPTKDSWQKHQEAKKKGLIPKNASIGGEIGIHGVVQGNDYLIDKKTNWTLGCISLKNKDINEVYSIVQKGTEMEILH
ncbi:MAG: L,D-transpeptidase [bacterium]